MSTPTRIARKAVTARYLTHQTTDIMEGIFNKLLPSAKPLRKQETKLNGRGVSTKGGKRGRG